MSKDLNNNIKVVEALASKSVANTTPVNGNEIDRKGYHSLVFIDEIQPAAYTKANYVNVKLQHSADKSTWTDVDEQWVQGDLDPVVATLAAMKINQIGYIGHERYVRMVKTMVGSVADLSVHALAVLGNPEYTPA